MDKAKFVRSLSIDEINEIIVIAKSELERRAKRNKGLITERPVLLLKDFLEEVEMPKRIRNILTAAYDEGVYFTLNDITYYNFIALQQVGNSTWPILLRTIKKMIEDKKFEPCHETLIKHFKKEGKGFFWVD